MKTFILAALWFALAIPTYARADGLPPNTIDCSQFKKIDGAWTEIGTATFDIGSSKGTKLSDQPITPHAFGFDGYDLYAVLEKKCSAH